MAGGFNNQSDQNNTFIVHPSGFSQSITNNKLFKNNQVDIYPGTVIYVPRDLARYQNLAGYALIAPIFSSLALSIASLNSLGD